MIDFIYFILGMLAGAGILLFHASVSISEKETLEHKITLAKLRQELKQYEKTYDLIVEKEEG